MILDLAKLETPQETFPYLDEHDSSISSSLDMHAIKIFRMKIYE